jgi:hypothetical protein
MNVLLQWHGPFSVVEGTNLPYLFDPANKPADHPGVYLWTIHSNGEEFVQYVGKTDVTLRGRLWTEFQPNRKPGWDWIPDPEELLRGHKVWLYEPKGVRKPHMEKWLKNEAFFKECWKRYLQLLRIFIAPMSPNKTEIRDTETALMWAVWDHEDANWDSEQQEDYFLTNGRPIPRRLSHPFNITMSTHARFRGLGEVISNKP